MLTPGLNRGDRLASAEEKATVSGPRCHLGERNMPERPGGTAPFGGLRITEIIDAGTSPQADAMMSGDDEDCWLLILQLSGRSLLSPGAVANALDPGDLLLVDARGPLRRQATPHAREVCVRLPGDLLKPRMAMPQPAPPCLIDGNSAIGSVLRAFVCSLLNAAGPLCAREEAGIRDALVQLAAAAYCGARERCADHSVGRWSGRGAHDAPMRQWEILLRSVETLLPDPALNPAMVAALHRISTRHLHRLFRQAGLSFGSYVRNRRLEHCRDDLADPRFAGLPLTEIAYRWGFCDSSHFSRCFKAAFGCTAREFRSRDRRYRRVTGRPTPAPDACARPSRSAVEGAAPACGEGGLPPLCG